MHFPSRLDGCITGKIGRFDHLLSNKIFNTLLHALSRGTIQATTKTTEDGIPELTRIPEIMTTTKHSIFSK